MKGLDYITKKISVDKGLDFKMVDRINKFYWKEGVREKVSSWESTQVYMKNIGTLEISYFKLKSYIRTLIRTIRSIPTSKKYKEHTKAIKLAEAREELRNALIKKNELATFYYHENLRNGRYPRILKVDPKVLQEPGADN